ncbi:hypothetical protein [Mucisphaera calidilacus]|uniref:Uncharacterized protein n=1 Tax=Mucisphaera calidilacus TaxID=2527982 RepID=A0A518BVQ4_9BACT|nr:hypothetical protein [Mucisphaera calidilacus]QDU71041.1 hypothetical protein Pan265_08860 [Mucisphaera calidilacus]
MTTALDTSQIARVTVTAAGHRAEGHELIAAQPGQRICVLGGCLMAAGAVNAAFYSGPLDRQTPLCGLLPMAAHSCVVLGLSPDASIPWLVCEVGDALTLSLDADVLVAGWLIYTRKQENGGA